MNDFEYDCLQKKRIAGSARKRKVGSKSKKCSLPSDRLTKKQWKDKCGPVITYNLDLPMEWSDFKKMPADIQTEYIVKLQRRYGVTAVDLGAMFGVKSLAVRRHAETHGLSVTFPRGRAMCSREREDWDRFLSGTAVTQENNAAEEQVLMEEPIEAADDCHAVAENPTTVVFNYEDAESNNDGDVADGMSMKQFNIKFTGKIDVDRIANSLKLILGNNSSGELEIICNLM